MDKTQQMLLDKIQQARFACIELRIYLDTHPDDALAQADYLASNAILEVLFKYGNLQSVMRGAMSFMGIDAGFNPAPFTEMAPEKIPMLKAELSALKDRLQIEGVELLDEASHG